MFYIPIFYYDDDDDDHHHNVKEYNTLSTTSLLYEITMCYVYFFNLGLGLSSKQQASSQATENNSRFILHTIFCKVITLHTFSWLDFYSYDDFFFVKKNKMVLVIIIIFS